DSEFMLELEDSTESLLMEALRQLDELRRIAPDLPAPTERMTLPKRVEPLLSSLEPLELDVVQLIYNLGLTQHVFDQSPATDYETATAILNLISQGYVERNG